jgi:hypothetical protein
MRTSLPRGYSGLKAKLAGDSSMDGRPSAAAKPALETGKQEQRRPQRPSMKLTQQQLEAHLWGAANILRGKTAGQDYKKLHPIADVL